jgi:PST family polysaccharide transporter
MKVSADQSADVQNVARVANYFGENKPRGDIARRALRGGVVSIGARVVNAVVQMGSVVILARLLSPEDYGLISMVSAMVGIAPMVVDLGSRDALIQQPHIAPGEISALFWITVAMGCGLSAIVAGSGPLIAHFYGEPRLTLIALVSSLSVLALSLGYQHQALLRRAMMYRELAIIDVGANMVATGIAVAMALRGYAYWSLAVRPVIISLVSTAWVWLKCRWLPGRPTFTVGVKEMLKFGLHWVGFVAVDFAGSFADRIAIGHSYGPIGLGYYQKASLVYDNSLDMVTTPLHPVAMAGLSKLRNNPEELRNSWAKALSTVAFFAMPAFGILAVISRDVMVLALGEKWTTASILISILALRGIPHVMVKTAGWLHFAAGRADRFMRWGVISTVAQLLALFAGLPFGTQGVAWAYVLSMYIVFLPAIAYSGRPLGVGLGKVVGVVGPETVGALTAVVLGFLFRETVFAHTAMALRALFLTISYIVIYLVIVVGLFRVLTPLRVASSLLRVNAP